MKVNIGTYKSWFGPHQMADLLQKVGVSEDRCYKIGEWLSETPVTWVCQKIEDKRKRKISIKIDKWDTWSMDHTLSLIVLPMLKQLKERKHGAPADMEGFGRCSYNNGTQTHFGFYKQGDEDADAAGFTQWDGILEKMIWSFTEIVKDEDPDFWIVKPVWHDKWDDNWVEEENGMSRLKIKSAGKVDTDAMREYHKKVQEGLSLFGKYYRNLWD
jgi:hypothetical protein